MISHGLQQMVQQAHFGLARPKWATTLPESGRVPYSHHFNRSLSVPSCHHSELGLKLRTCDVPSKGDRQSTETRVYLRVLLPGRFCDPFTERSFGIDLVSDRPGDLRRVQLSAGL